MSPQISSYKKLSYETPYSIEKGELGYHHLKIGFNRSDDAYCLGHGNDSLGCDNFLYTANQDWFIAVFEHLEIIRARGYSVCPSCMKKLIRCYNQRFA